jgi:hypothetical protein
LLRSGHGNTSNHPAARCDPQGRGGGSVADAQTPRRSAAARRTRARRE